MFEKLFTQRIYADTVGHRLDLFKIQSYSPYRANFRCPICGDSQKNKYRKRAYFLEKNQALVFHCHNECGSMSFERFMKDYYGDIYTTYKFDLFRNMRESNTEVEHKQINTYTPVVHNKTNDIDLQRARDNKISLEYLKSRMIPDKFIDDIYYTDKFHEYINEVIPDKFPSEIADKSESRIVMPMRGYDNNIFGVISRSLEPSSNSRYLTIKFDEESPKIFGLNRINRDKMIYVTEGPIDSFFIDNCVALAGTDGNPDNIFSSKKDYVMVLDNQPRSESIIKKYQMYINRGCSMFIWPKWIKEKDINDCILNDIDINSIIKQNTFCGLKLKIKFNDWKRI